MQLRDQFTPAEIDAFAPDSKVGLLATRDGDGLPHISLITTLAASDAAHLTWGQFCEGESKRNVGKDGRVGFLVLDMERNMWRGKALWTHSAGEGEEFIAYNQRPMFRYNSYFGIHTVHYMDLVGVTDKVRLSVPRMLAGFAMASAGGLMARSRRQEPALKPWAQKLLAKPDTLKFIAHIDDDGYPRIIPAVAASPGGSQKLVFAATAYRDELMALVPGRPVALFALNLKMESVLVRGNFAGYKGVGVAKLGTIDVDWVYNSMPPQQGQVYPMPPLEAVRSF
jgi:hypothetical protein